MENIALGKFSLMLEKILTPREEVKVKQPTQYSNRMRQVSRPPDGHVFEEVCLRPSIPEGGKDRHLAAAFIQVASELQRMSLNTDEEPSPWIREDWRDEPHVQGSGGIGSGLISFMMQR